MRGSPVGRTDWKRHPRPLFFFKRIRDVGDAEHKAMLAESARGIANHTMSKVQGARGCDTGARCGRKPGQSGNCAAETRCRGIAGGKILSNQKQLTVFSADREWNE